MPKGQIRSLLKSKDQLAPDVRNELERHRSAPTKAILRRLRGLGISWQVLVDHFGYSRAYLDRLCHGRVLWTECPRCGFRPGTH